MIEKHYARWMGEDTPEEIAGLGDWRHPHGMSRLRRSPSASSEMTPIRIPVVARAAIVEREP